MESNESHHPKPFSHTTPKPSLRSIGGDNKLFKRVSQLIQSNPSWLSKGDGFIAEKLRDTYPEYKRKPNGPLCKHINSIIQDISKSNPQLASSKTNSRTQKRSRSEPEDFIASENSDSHDDRVDTTNSLNSMVLQAYSRKTNNDSPTSTKSSKKKKRKTEEKNKDSTNNTQEFDDVVVNTTVVVASVPEITFADIGGIEGILEDIRESIERPLKHPEIYEHLGVECPQGILLHGPPGCGKTMLAHAIAGELGVAFLKISAPEIVSGMSGESEEKIRQIFASAQAAAPSILFIDEIDAIASKRDSSAKGMERRIVAQILTCMDSLRDNGSWISHPCIVIGATNRPDALDNALRRAGRFDREIILGIPDESARARILSVITRNMKLEGTFEFTQLARRTPGFVGADLSALAKEAAALAVTRIFHDLFENSLVFGKGPDSGSGENVNVSNTSIQLGVGADHGAGENEEKESINGDGSAGFRSTSHLSQTNSQDKPLTELKLIRSRNVSDGLRNQTKKLTPEQLAPLSIRMSDFESAISKVQPSALREGFATIPNVSFSDIGALGDVRRELDLSIVQPMIHPERFIAIGLSMPAGVLLYGPPGCGKTLLAKAIANESRANFISIKGPELLNKFVGESERAVRQVFQRARASSPCVVFFDELDALCPRRGVSGDSSGASERVVNQLLTEMDGLESRGNVFVIAATNRPDIIDPAMLRPGRLDKLLYVPLPSPEGRVSILKTIVRQTPLAPDVDLELIGNDSRCIGYSGADLAALVREASIFALREIQSTSPSDESAYSKVKVTANHFEAALSTVAPSVSLRDMKEYDKMQSKLRKARSHLDQHNQITQDDEDKKTTDPK